MSREYFVTVAKGMESQGYVITPAQAKSRWYSMALDDEIAASQDADVRQCESSRINHPEILAYKARVLGGQDTNKEYAAWTQFLVNDYGPRTACLSLGSGFGRIEQYLIRHGFTQKFEAIELSPYANGAVKGADSRIDAREGDLNFVSLEAERYDFVLCHGVLHHLINLEHVLGEVNKALKSDGLLLIYEYVGETRWQFDESRLQMLRERFPGVQFHRPNVWEVSGFESVRSWDLLELIRWQFEDKYERAVSYGGAYFPFVTCTKPAADMEMKHVVAVDEELSQSGSIAPCYHMGVYRKSGRGIRPVIPWTEEDVRWRLAPSRPLSSRITHALRRTILRRPLRAIKQRIQTLLPS